MRIAVASPDFEARLAEMRNVGEAGTGRELVGFHAKAYQIINGRVNHLMQNITKTLLLDKISWKNSKGFTPTWQVLDQRLAEMRAEAATVPEGVRSA